ncbi:HPr family phosphocarrier protein [Paenibacillus sp. P26]|nr:HPr family phosphocarrier protein [Paenibacillus sp. P26]UUZ91849.1 HPr family phosphocarrier protein [Paenibacillus sp. P25]
MSGIETKAIVEINQAASRFASSIVVLANEKHIDVKSILGLSLTLFNNQEYKLEIHGPDETEAKAAMADVFQKHGLRVTVLDN